MTWSLHCFIINRRWLIYKSVTDSGSCEVNHCPLLYLCRARVLWDWNSPIQEAECWLHEEQTSISLPWCPRCFKRHSVVLWLLLLVGCVYCRWISTSRFLGVLPGEPTHGSKILMVRNAWLNWISRVLNWNLFHTSHFGFGVCGEDPTRHWISVHY